MSNVELAPIEYLKEQKIYFCVMCNNSTVSEHTFKSFNKWQVIAKQIDLDWTLETFDIAQSRNFPIAQFLGQPGYTHMVFVDYDMVFEPWQILALISSKKHIISGLYPRKEVPPVVETKVEENMRKEGPIVEAAETGMGFTLISREALIHLQDHQDVIPFKNKKFVGEDAEPFLKSYYQDSVRGGQYLTAEQEFCYRWRDIGGHIWAHSQVIVSRIGLLEYEA